MRLPSIQQVFDEARRTVVRFPLALISAMVLTVAALVVVDHKGELTDSAAFKFQLTAVLGFILMLAMALIAERRKWSAGLSFGVQGLGVLLLIAYGFTVPSWLPVAPAMTLIRFVILAVALCFLVMVGPFASRGEVNGFWQYNVAMLYRLLMTLLFSGVLFVGLALAMAALDNLFGVDIDAKRYFQLWIVIACLFAPWFFLAGIPTDLGALESSQEYPKGLKVFAQYVLFSLVLVYFVILYAYLAKIVIEWNWPKGWVAAMILGFTITGIISMVMLYPLRDREGNAWIRTAWRWYFIALVPLVVVLFLAINRRISEYGVTEDRYLVVAMGIWLVFLIGYFTFSRARSIKMIPASLCVVSLLVSSGPWGVFAISEKTQVGRLRELLVRNEILVDGKVQKAVGTVPFKDRREISSILSYLRTNHGLETIQPWFVESLKDSSKTSHEYVEADVITPMMGFKFANPWLDRPDASSWVSSDRTTNLELTGYDWLIRDVSFSEVDSGTTRTKGGLVFRSGRTLDTLHVAALVNDVRIDSVAIWLPPVVDSVAGFLGGVAGNEPVPAGKMCLAAESQKLRVKLYLTGMRVEQKDSVRTIKGYSADVIYKLSRPE